MSLTRINNKIVTNWYCKSTSSGRILNYFSNHPYQIKKNVALSFINKVILLSDDQFKNENRYKIHRILEKNNYPQNLVKKLICEAYNKIYQNLNQNLNHEEKIFRKLTYIPKLSNKLSKTLKNTIPNLKFGYAAQNQLRKNYTNLKDKIGFLKRTNVVYQIPCDCTKTYIGQTSQPLKNRIQQHKNDIRNKSENTALSTHSIECNRSFNFNNTKIVATEANTKRREFIEMGHIILNSNSTVNFRRDTQFLHSNYKHIINTYKFSRS